MRSLAATDFSNYRQNIERQSIAAHREFIDAQMAQAREAVDDAQRSGSLANVIAANGMLLRGMEVGFITGEPDYQAIREIAEGIQATRAFRNLMADGGGERLAKNGSVDALVRDLQERDLALSEEELAARPAMDVIRGIQTKVRARTAQPRDFAMLAAAHRMTTWKGKICAPDGKIVDTVRHDVSKQLDGKMLREEAGRVMADPDFQYLIEHEKTESLYINALRANGAAFGQYRKRAGQLRAREAERGGTERVPPAAPQKSELNSTR